MWQGTPRPPRPEGAERLPERGRASLGFGASPDVLGMKVATSMTLMLALPPSQAPSPCVPSTSGKLLAPSPAPRGHRDDRMLSTWGPLRLMISFIAS